MSARDRHLQQHVARLTRRRAHERADALDFILNGHDGHAERCVHAQACAHDAGCQREACQPCSRNYDPRPRGAESEPQPPRDYAGTGIGALYGLPGSEQHLWQLAGWNVSERAR